MTETAKEAEAVWTRKIAYVSEQYQEAEKKGVKRVEELYLCTEDKDRLRPVVLGAGNYAVVILAANSVVPANASEFFALKLLRKDTESTIYSDIGLMRFYSEVAKTRNFIGNFPYLVGYRGFGKTVATKNAPRSRRDEKELNDVYGAQLKDVVNLNKEEGLHDFLEQGLKVALLGDFYVMRAESGTLGDFLLQEFHWEQNPIYVTSPRWKNQLQSMRSSNDERVNPAKELIEKEKIDLDRENRSGLGILRAIDKKNPQFANRAVVELFVEMLQPIAELHNRENANAQDNQEAQAGWAHRDIKPHNFLVGFNPPTPRIDIKATDLGFVIGTSDAGKKETLSSTKDPGVLALGSYLYRAPEQRESRYEILFELDPVAKEVTTIDQISFLNVGDMAISEGDLFESDNFFIGTAKKSDPGTPIRTTIKEAKPEGGKWKLTFSDRLVPRASQILYSGDVVKMTGQHTDLFSLGAALYLLASGGKNPEKFYIKYLEEVPYEGDESETDLGSIARSCFTIAMSLCLQPWDDISKQAETLYKDVLTDEDKEFLQSYRSSQAEVTVKKSWFSKANKNKQPDQGLAAYLTTLRENPMLRYYASNKNNKPIPFCILFEIVRLMVRGKTHSYVDEMKKSPEETGTYGYFALDLEAKARACRDSCTRALAEAQELAFNAGQYPRVADTAAQMVFVLRVLFKDIVEEKLLDENGEEKPPPAASGVGTSADDGVVTKTSSSTA